MKRVFLFAVLSSVLLSCTGNGEREARNRYSSSFPLAEEHPDHSLMAKWEGKEVLDSHLLDDMEVPGKWKVRIGHPSLGYTKDNCFEGNQALRYTVSMVDWDHINAPSERSPWGSFAGSQGGWSCISLEFDEPQDWTAYNRIAFRVYIHPSRNPNVSFFFNLINGTGKDSTLTPGRETNFDIPQGEWRQVLWEIDYLPRDSVRRFDICQTMTGYDRDIGEQYVTLDFDSLELQKVEPDHYEGWDLPEGSFAFSHIGYRPGDHKSALAGMSGERKFSIVDNEGRTVYTGKAGTLSNKGNDFAVLDFSRLRRPGVYTIRYGDMESKPFPIEDDVWLTPLFSAVNFYFCQRCGYPVEGIHGICHQDWQGFHGDEKKVINGGWHDAGDLSQGAWRTAYACYALMSAFKACSERKDLKDLSARLLDEASWGVDWLLKTRFSDGYHMSWSAQRIYSDNVTGTPDDVVSMAAFVPWELFQTSAVFSSAAGLLEEARRKELEAAAKEDWGNAMKSRADWDSATYLEASWGAIASTLLFEKYKDEEYRSAALMFGRLLMDCQEQEYVDGIPYRGYFYTDNSRKSILKDYHAAFNEAPMMAIGLLGRVFPKEKDAPLWKQAAMIFINDYLKPGIGISAPYGLLPAGIFRRVDVAGYPDQLTQYEDGTQINDDYAIRTFPIWHDHIFHESTNQQEFLHELYHVNRNIVLVLVAGSPLSILWEDKNIPAIVNAWYPGQEGGTAVAEVLFGKYNPAGKVPVTYYNRIEDLPPFDDYDITKRTYKYFDGDVLYPFGHGLSYTSFRYSDLKVEDRGETLDVTLNLKNTGRYDGDEVVQVYTRLPEYEGTAPIKELRGFKRVHLKKGQSKTVTIALRREDLRYWSETQKKFIVPEGPPSIMVGSSSADIRLKTE